MGASLKFKFLAELIFQWAILFLKPPVKKGFKRLEKRVGCWDY